jgi:adenine phosphoribosyltransferase
MDFARYIRDVPDFPKPGIVFKDITPLLASPQALKAAIDRMAAFEWGGRIDRVAGIESRGFLFGVPLALRLGCGFTPIRKPGKLPWRTDKIDYALEYGTDTLEIHKDGIHKGERVLVVDDLLATGGTLKAACDLIAGIGGTVAGCALVVELAFLSGRDRVGDHNIQALISF